MTSSKTTLKEALRVLLPRQLKSHRIRGGPLSGRRIYTSWHDYPGAIRGDTESPLLNWFSRNVRQGETWLDVGAHYGYTAIALAQLVGSNGRVVAFEPVLSTAACLARTRDLNRLMQLEIVPLGLSSEAGIVSRRLPVHRGMAEGGIAEANAASGNRVELIFIAGFDALWESLCRGNPVIHGVKIDVQGMETSVLIGMTRMLSRWRPKLVVEFHHGVDSGRILDLLESIGYRRVPEPVEGMSDRIEPDRSYAFIPNR